MGYGYKIVVETFDARKQINHVITEIEKCRQAKADIKKSQMNSLLMGAILNAIDGEIAKLKGELKDLIDKL